MIGSGLQGCELAEFLTWRGRKVTLVDTSARPGASMVDAMQHQLFRWFKKKGVTFINGVKEYVEINDQGLVIIDKEGQKRGPGSR